MTFSTAFLWLGIALCCSKLANVHGLAMSQVAKEHRMSEEPTVRDSTKLTLEQLAIQNVDPNRFALTALQDSPFAWTISAPAPVKPGCEVLYIADPETTTSWFANEWERGSVPWNWPSLNDMLKGQPKPNATSPPIEVLAAIHQKIRKEVFYPNMLTDAAVTNKLPGIQATVQKHIESWSKQETASCFDGSLTMLFDVVANTVLQMGLSSEEIKKYSDLMETWNQGMVARVQSETDPVYGKAMEAREVLKQRFLQALSSPSEGSMLQSFNKAFGPAYIDVIISQIFLLFFGSFETVPSVLCGLFWHAQQTPRVWQRIRTEQQAVVSRFGPNLSLPAINAMRFTTAAFNESFRMAQAVSFSSRLATKPIQAPGAPAVKAGCPFVMAWGAMSARDPAVAPDPSVFRPERWLDPKNIESLTDHQIPLGKGTHGCPGYRLARAVMLAVTKEVSLKYSVFAQARLGFDEWPTGGRPVNGLPLVLRPQPEGR